MTSTNELRNFMAQSVFRKSLLNDGQVGQASSGDRYLRAGHQVFRITVGMSMKTGTRMQRCRDAEQAIYGHPASSLYRRGCSEHARICL